ncbi:MAG: molybdopterin-dependent oxidoreductase, partial [Deltaproteobacteria bacterium]|nr:molybdopterin-dependent oxidoreductase [Deltaproteobacteria bacterium]
MERSERRTYCRICPALCGLRIEIEGERIKRVRGDRQHPLTRGYFCRKGQALGAFHHHPRRLNAPTLGRPPQRRVTSWEESLDDLAVRLSRILDESGPDAIGFYFGTWAWLDALGWRTADAMLSRLGSRSRYSALTVDGVPRAMVGEMVAGNARLLPNIDRDETRMLLLVGTNPVIAHGHSSSWPRGAELLREVARRGEVWVADPRRTESARLATRHLPLRAGSDAFLLAGLLRSLLHEGGADHDYLADHAAGSERLAAAVAPFGLERVASATGLEPEAVAALAHSIRRHGRLAVATGTGVTMAREGLVTEWLAWALQIVTGSFDRPGGAWFNPGYLTRFDQRPLAPGPETPLPGPPSRPDLPSPRGERPCAALSDEIESGNLR